MNSVKNGKRISSVITQSQGMPTNISWVEWLTVWELNKGRSEVEINLTNADGNPD